MDRATANQLLCECLRVGPQAAGLERLSASDWRTLIEQASRQRVAALLYQNARTVTLPETVPASVLEPLADAYMGYAARNAGIYNELSKVLTAFQDHGIPAIVLKGADLAERVYGNIALRPMADVDLLVRLDDLEAIEGALAELGYAPLPGLLDPAYYRRNHFHIPYQGSRAPALTLEIHWDLREDLSLVQMDLDEIWQGAMGVRLGGAETLGMGLEVLLLYLCFHLDKHGFYNRYWLTRPKAKAVAGVLEGTARLIWFYDVWTVLQRKVEQVDWSRFVDKARRWGIEEAVYCSLYFVECLFGPSGAERALAELRPPRLRWYERFGYKLLTDLSAPETGERKIRRWLRAWLLEPDTRVQFRPARLVTLPGYLFPGREVVARHYGITGPLVALYYVHHIAQLLTKTIAGLVQLVYYSARKG